MPGSNVLSMTQAGAGIHGAKAVRLYGRLLYELLSGRAPLNTGGQPHMYKALPELDQSGNQILRRALADGDSEILYKSCQEFWVAFKDHLMVRPGPPAKPAVSFPPPPSESPSQPKPPTPRRRTTLVPILILAAGALVVVGAILLAAWSGAFRGQVKKETSSEQTVSPRA